MFCSLSGLSKFFSCLGNSIHISLFLTVCYFEWSTLQGYQEFLTETIEFPLSKNQTKCPIEVWTLKQEIETDDNHATMRESFSLFQKILFDAFSASFILRWSFFQVIAICTALAVVPTAILLVSFTGKNMVFENIARFTHAENHSFPLCLVTHKQHIIHIYQFGKFIWRKMDGRKMTNEKDGLTTMLQCQNVKKSWRHNL